MTIGRLVSLMQGGIEEVFILIVPVLSVALVVGLIVAIFQATTSIQEQTLTFFPKFIAIFGVLALLGGWQFTHLKGFVINLFKMIPNL